MEFSKLLLRHPSLPYVVPFATVMAFIAVQDYNPLPPAIEFPLRLAVLTAVLWLFSRDLVDFHAAQPVLSACLGLGVFVLWILPGELFPHYREHWLFQNALTGTLRSSLPAEARSDGLILTMRSIRAVLLIPLIEELFWRAWLLRWLISPRFEDIRLGTFNRHSFWITAVLFGAEHGPFWDVGIVTGALFNWWMIRTRSLGDCVLAHAVTNAALCGFVIATHKWEYWL